MKIPVAYDPKFLPDRQAEIYLSKANLLRGCLLKIAARSEDELRNNCDLVSQLVVAYLQEAFGAEGAAAVLYEHIDAMALEHSVDSDWIADE